MFRCFSLIFLLCLPPAASAADDAYEPKIAAASGDAELALQGFVLPKGITASLLAAEPSLANPVAFHVAADGRVFVCETFRQEVGVEDNRSHMNWLENDLRLESVEERLAMFRRYLGSDIVKYGTQHDRIRVLQDTNGDGTLDDHKVFAQGFNDILDGTGAGVLEHNGKVYYTCLPKLWLLEDTNDDGVADRHEYLHHGYGVRVAFRGHDMHGLTIGPDGRLYFSIGDRGFNVITPEGTRLKRPDCGAVFRCDMDGSHLEVFAYGLRNPQELAFDNHGNLFTVDNNSDSGDQARLAYIVQGGDSGWRMYFQYLDDRGPWNRERMWYPWQSDEETTAVQPVGIMPPVANVSDGPSGLTFYPGLGLSERYQDHFFLADFRGASGNSGIRSFRAAPKGAHFELTDSHQFIWSILATDVDFAPDGSLYVTDWVNGWVGEGKGRLYRFADSASITAVAGANVPSLLNGGIVQKQSDELFSLLDHADRRVRQAAQFELVRRDALEELCRAAGEASSSVVQRHVAWALWQLGLKSAKVSQRVAAICGEKIGQAEDVGIQYTRILADLVHRHGIDAVVVRERRDQLRSRLAQQTQAKDLRAAGFAAVALGSLGRTADTDHLVALLDRNNATDPVVRHQAVMGLTELALRSPLCLAGAMNHPSAAVRRSLAVAFSRIQNTRSLIALLSDGDPDVVLEATRALMDERLGIAEADVVALWNSPGQSNALQRRCLEAACRLGTAQTAAAVAQIAADETRSSDVRAVAVEMLKTWNRPQQTDTVTGRWRPLPQREVDGLEDAIRPALAGILAGPQQIRDAGVAVAAQFGIRDVIPVLQSLFENVAAEDSSRVAAFRALAALSDSTDELLILGQNDRAESIRMAAVELLVQRDPVAAIPVLSATIASGSVKSRQLALRLLAEIRTPKAEGVVQTAFRAFHEGAYSGAVALELLQAAEAHNSPELRRMLNEFRSAQKAGESRVSEWSECLEGGDAERGKTVFFGRAAASCRRCHKVNGNGAEVGPDLSAVAKDKDRHYLLESLVDPNAKIAKGFETTIIVDLDGRIHSGIIKEENEELVRLMTPQGALISVAKADIEDRAKGQSGMPSDITKALSRSDVRDLVEYLASLKKVDDSGHGASGE